MSRSSSGIQPFSANEDRTEFRLYQKKLTNAINDRLFKATTPFKLPRPKVEPKGLNDFLNDRIEDQVQRINFYRCVKNIFY